jgi:hypothetical protein
VWLGSRGLGGGLIFELSTPRTMAVLMGDSGFSFSPLGDDASTAAAAVIASLKLADRLMAGVDVALL